MYVYVICLLSYNEYIDKVYSLLMGLTVFCLHTSLKHVPFTLDVPNIFYNE